MYLVHVHVQPPVHGVLLPSGTADAVAACGRDVTGVEHVVVHADTHPHPVIGVYISAATLKAAEETAVTLWHHTLLHHHWLHPWTLLRAEVPLIPIDADRPGMS
ncbi:hypothetical protein D0Z67_00020 [Streptomyces seoulensis]|uniref:Uncharacterized protein n=1 Tax=Streptomyces seoulensis TaxID=73044 RepID=A0A4P6TTX1_STRSO|nr:hypothetical protein [Streptomyces seoulensis]QBJ88868.1 hypothetical protein D0Z67_00020 [Streptomyces seoulensis]